MKKKVKNFGLVFVLVSAMVLSSAIFLQANTSDGYADFAPSGYVGRDDNDIG